MLIEIPIRIVSIIVVSLIMRAILHRMINRVVRPVHVGDVPRILRPFKERVEGSGLLESTGLLSERRSQRAATIGSVLKSGVSFTILVIAFLLVLSELGINLAPFIAGTSIVGVALGFGAQNIVKDFLSGMFMMLEDQYGVGDVIDFEKAAGTVEAVGLRTTRLRDVNGTVWYVRNGEVVRVGNKSQGFAQVVLDVPIDAAADIETASAAMLAVAQQMRGEEDWADVVPRRARGAGRRGADPRGDRDPAGRAGAARRAVAGGARIAPPDPRAAGPARTSTRHLPPEPAPLSRISWQRAHRVEDRAVQRRERVVHRSPASATGTSAWTARVSRPSISPPYGLTTVAPTSTPRSASSTTLTNPSLPGPWIQPRLDDGDRLAAGADPEPLLARLLLGHPDPADLGIGEGHPGQPVVAAERLVALEQVGDRGPGPAIPRRA